MTSYINGKTMACGRLETPTLSELRERIRIGRRGGGAMSVRKVSQVYCSALPVAYTQHPPGLWEHFARLVLQASYEATICAAILNGQNNENNRVFLTLLGGGAFGNPTAWIMDAIKRALNLYKGWDIEVAIVSYGGSKAYVRQLVEEFQR